MAVINASTVPFSQTHAARCAAGRCLFCLVARHSPSLYRARVGISSRPLATHSFPPMPANRFYSAFDTATLKERPAAPGEYRNAFQIDRDRIIHSSAFRRLQSKTQVFLSGEYDFYRTRLTHSIEVAQIGRSICSYLQQSDLLADDCFIDPDLVESACLAHDLGHPPFGHTGERTLHALMQPYGGFEGNAQTLRILTQTIFSEGRDGMNPTRALLDGVLKYKTLQAETPDCAESLPLQRSGALARLRARGPGLPCRTHTRQSAQRLQVHRVPDHGLGGRHRVLAQRRGRWHPRRIHQPGKARTLGLHAVARQRMVPSTSPILCKAIRDQRVEARLNRMIGECIRAVSLRATSNFLSPQSETPCPRAGD
ncbi:MAG: dNTP triphosphohydrolase [Candidatus Promineifilaceae bacterium]